MTDKYAGHTDGVWEIITRDDDPYGNICVMPKESNYHVIATLWQDDAPLPDLMQNNVPMPV